MYKKTNRKKTIDPICFKFKIFLSSGPAHPADGAKNKGGVIINFVHSTTKIQTENEKLKFCLKRKKKGFTRLSAWGCLVQRPLQCQRSTTFFHRFHSLPSYKSHFWRVSTWISFDTDEELMKNYCRTEPEKKTMPPTPKTAVSPVKEKLRFYRFSKDKRRNGFKPRPPLSIMLHAVQWGGGVRWSSGDNNWSCIIDSVTPPTSEPPTQTTSMALFLKPDTLLQCVHSLC